MTKKPYVERPEGNGTGNSALAEDAHAKHKLREDSVVQNIFGSQMLSQLTCLQCGHVSVCFEFQNTIPIAIPRNTIRSVRVCFVPKYEGLGHVLSPNQTNRGSRVVVEGLTKLRGTCLRPLLMNLELDTLSPVSKLVDEVMTMLSRKSVIKDFDVSGERSTDVSAAPSEPSEDCVESVCGSMYRVGTLLIFLAKKAPTARSAAAFSQKAEFIPEPMLQRPIANDEIIHRLPMDITLYAFSVPERKVSGQFYCFVFQVLVHPTFMLVVSYLSVSVFCQRNIAHADCSAQMAGYPLQISLSLDMSCLEVRLTIWRQISRYFYDCDIKSEWPNSQGDDHDLSFGQRVFAADANDDVFTMHKFAAALPLREVDEHGNPVLRDEQSEADAEAEVAINGEAVDGGFNNNGGFPKGSQTAKLGRLFPSSPDVKVGTFAEKANRKAGGPLFLTLDWSHSWQKARSVLEVSTVSCFWCIGVEVITSILSANGFD